MLVGMMCSCTTRVIQADGFKTLNEGDKVEYEAERGPKGMQATKVVKL